MQLAHGYSVNRIVVLYDVDLAVNYECRFDVTSPITVRIESSVIIS